MAQTNKAVDVPVRIYMRTTHGTTFYVDSLEEALQIFISKEGYRIGFLSAKEDVKVTFRRQEFGLMPADDQNLYLQEDNVFVQVYPTTLKEV